jgi:hypothetical protein
LEVYEFQVSGKTPKYIDNVNGTIYKQFSLPEYQFYEFLAAIPANDPRGELKIYIPQYFGMKEQEGLPGTQEGKEGSKRNVWIDHIASRSKSEAALSQKFILLRNMTFGYGTPNIMDLKLGVKKAKKTNVKF